MSRETWIWRKEFKFFKTTSRFLNVQLSKRLDFTILCNIIHKIITFVSYLDLKREKSSYKSFSFNKWKITSIRYENFFDCINSTQNRKLDHAVVTLWYRKEWGQKRCDYLGKCDLVRCDYKEWGQFLRCIIYLFQ